MTRRQQRALLRAILNNMRDHLLAQSARWPAEWDGHDLRELVYLQANRERTNLMRESRKRCRAVYNAAVVERLY